MNRRTVIALSVAALVLGCSGREKAEEADALVAIPNPGGPTSRGPATTPPAKGPGAAATPPSRVGATAPAPRGDTDTLVTPSGCDDDVIVLRECWTEKFPPDISGKSDVKCRFTVYCCGKIVQRVERFYPQSAGPSGVALYDQKRTSLKCRPSPGSSFGDLDGDGTGNAEDANPLAAGSSLPWQ